MHNPPALQAHIQDLTCCISSAWCLLLDSLCLESLPAAKQSRNRTALVLLKIQWRRVCAFVLLWAGSEAQHREWSTNSKCEGLEEEREERCPSGRVGLMGRDDSLPLPGWLWHLASGAHWRRLHGNQQLWNCKQTERLEIRAGVRPIPTTHSRGLSAYAHMLGTKGANEAKWADCMKNKGFSGNAPHTVKHCKWCGTFLKLVGESLRR